MARTMLGQDSSHAAPARAAVSRVAYTSFSPRLAPSLIAAGGLLAIIGGLGLWVRAVSLTSGAAHQTASITGIGHAWGWLIAGLGAVAFAGSLIRSSSTRWLLAVVSSGSVILIALRISHLSGQASAMAFRAGAEAGRAFSAYHAGFGWGAWALTLAAVLLSLGTIVTLLRWLDERQGLAA